MVDPEKYRIELSERFPSVKFVVANKADSLYLGCEGREQLLLQR